jgi:hypothetical protein
MARIVKVTKPKVTGLIGIWDRTSAGSLPESAPTNRDSGGRGLCHWTFWASPSFEMARKNLNFSPALCSHLLGEQLAYRIEDCGRSRHPSDKIHPIYLSFALLEVENRALDFRLEE